MVDSTTIKALRTSASLASDGRPRELGRSAGGLTSKIHLIANIQQKPIDFILSPGQSSDAKVGAELIENNLGRIKRLLADKAYDSNYIRNMLDKIGAGICIPPKSNRKNPPSFDRSLYGRRSTIEIIFGRLKDWRGIAMRYCRNAYIFDSFICVALISTFFDIR